MAASQTEIEHSCSGGDDNGDTETENHNDVNNDTKKKVSAGVKSTKKTGPKTRQSTAAKGKQSIKSSGKQKDMGQGQRKITDLFPKASKTTDHVNKMDMSCDEDEGSEQTNSENQSPVPHSTGNHSSGNDLTPVHGDGISGNDLTSVPGDGSSGNDLASSHPSPDAGSSGADTAEATGNSPNVHIPGENITDCDTDHADSPASNEDTQKTEAYFSQENFKKRRHDSEYSEPEGGSDSQKQDAGAGADDFSDGEEGKMLQGMKKGGTSKKQSRPRMISKWSDTDTREYRTGYPGKKDNPKLVRNLHFYTNKISSEPNGGFVDDIHKEWWGNYKLLERHHGYIQWLFPIREKGMNFQSQVLQIYEIEAINKDRDARHRILKSYKMMLDFYGMRLVDSHRGIVERNKNWQERFHNLNTSYHNYLRITRILKSLGEFEYEYLKRPFLEFILNEAFITDKLNNCRNSCVDYWIHTLRVDEDRRQVLEKAQELSDKCEPKRSSWW